MLKDCSNETQTTSVPEALGLSSCHCEAGVGGHECKVNGRGVEPERAYSREDAHLTAKNIVLMMLKNTLRNIAYEIILNTVEKLKGFKSE